MTPHRRSFLIEMAIREATGRADERRCPTCRGNGWIAVRRILIGTGPVQLFEEDCPDCDGSGNPNLYIDAGEVG